VIRKHVAKDASRQAQSKRLRGENGVEMLEFALVIPIFVFVLYGLIAFGLMLSAKQTITNAASEGARAAVGATQGDQTAETAAAHDKVDAAMKSFSGYHVDDPGAFEADFIPCGINTCIKVTVKYDYASHPIVPPAPGLGLVTPDKLTSTAVVQVS
jgi:Flp pilus assembly protein TadG